MAEYKTVKGFNIETLSSDPSNLTEGQIWYNSTSNDLKGYADAAGAWASSTAMPAGHGLGAQIGTTTAAIVIAGNFPPDGYTNTTIEWDSSSWTAGGAMNTGRPRPMGSSCGTQTAGLAIGGYNPPSENAVEEYNGVGWTSVTNIPAATNNGGCAGIQTQALSFGGENPGTTATFSYDGTNWTAEAALATGRGYVNGLGTGTSAFLCGGGYPFDTPSNVLVEEWTSGLSTVTFTDS